MTSNTIDLTAPNHYPPTNGSGYPPYQNGNGFSGYTPPSSQDLTSTGLRNQFQYGSKPYYGTERSGSGFGNKGFNRETDPNYDRYGNNSRDSFREKGRESRDFQGTRETTYNRDYQRDYNRDYSRENRDFGRGERDYNGRENRDYNRDNNRDYNRDSYRNNNRGESRKYRFEDNDRKKFDDVGNDFGYKEDGLCEANPRLEKYLFEDNDGDKLIGEEPVLNFDSYNDIPVTVDGSPAKSNINTFEDLNLGVVLNSNIKLSKFKTPTPIQKFSIPIALSGKDLMACAQTGSGKTAAFLFPMIARIIQNRKQYHDEISTITRSTTVYPLALILAPTRELAIQIHVVAKKFCYRSHLRPVVVYGGHNFSKQAMEITNGCHILVATPGRLIDMIEKKIISVQCIKFLCFDEADRMLDMGFEEQMRKIVFNMGMPDKYRRQTSMFSATFPDSIRQMAKDFLNSYAFIAIGRIGSTTDLVKQHIKFVEENEKKQELLKLLKNIDGRVLVFSATKKSTDHLGYFLCQMGLAATSIHGDRSQTERENALRDFKSDRARILVATDVAARGLHIENVIHVINYDLPSNVEDYVHRIGRTGRCGKQGESTSFFNSSNVNIVKDLIQLLMDNKQTVPEWILDFGRDFNNKRKTKDNRMKKGGGGGYQKDWRRYNNYGNNNLYTGPKVFNFNHTNTLPERTHTGGGGPPTTYWKS